jgi:hypothetical protein
MTEFLKDKGLKTYLKKTLHHQVKPFDHKQNHTTFLKNTRSDMPLLPT